MIFQYPISYFLPFENEESDDARRINSMFRKLDEEETGSEANVYNHILKEMDEEYADQQLDKLK